VERSLWPEDGSVVYHCCWPSPAQSFSGPNILLSHIQDFPFRRLLRLARLRWRYLTPPPHGNDIWHLLGWCPRYKTPLHGQRRKHRFQSSSIVTRQLVAVGTCLFRSRYLGTAAYTCLLRLCCLAADVVSLFVSSSLPSNGSTRYSTIQGDNGC
jgi:hypothetical protein